MNTQRKFCTCFVALAFARLALGIMVSLAAASAAHAMNKTWPSAISSNFTGPGNWNPSGAPGATDQATFSAAGTYTVTFNNSPNPLPNPVLNQDLFFSAGNATFTSGTGGPFTYRLTGGGGSDANITGGTLTLGTGINPLNLTVDDDLVVRGGATLNVSHGSVVNTLDLVLAQAASGGNGTINVDGSGSALNVTDSTTQSLGLNGNPATLTYRNSSSGSITGPLDVGGSSSAALNLQTGAQLNVGNLSVGGGTGTGSLNINDAGSTLVQSGAASLSLGAASGGSSAINIATTAAGGTLTTGIGLFTINKTGTVSVGSATTSGTLNANGNVTIDGGVLQVLNPASSFALASGRTFTVQNGGQATFDLDGTYTTAANSIYNINGANSKYKVTSSFAPNQSPILNVDNGATVSVGTTGSGGVVDSYVLNIGTTGTLHVGSATTTGSVLPFLVTVKGVFDVHNSGSSFLPTQNVLLCKNTSVCGLTVSDGGRATFDLDGHDLMVDVTQHYNISGTNSKMEIVNGSGLTIGAGLGVTVDSGGLLSVAGNINLFNPPGKLAVDGGTVITNAISGGITFTSGTVGITGPAGLSWGQSGFNNVTTLDSTHNLSVTNTTTVGASGTLTLDGGTFNTGSLVFNYDGSFEFKSGTLGITGPAGLTIGAGGLLGSTMVLNANQTLNVTHTLNIDNGAYLNVVGGLGVGNLINNGDLIVVYSAVGGPVLNNHNVTVVGNVNFNGLVSGPGSFFGPGTAHFNGGLAPGASPANVSFEGSLALADTNTLFIEIGGSTPGSQYDRLTIAGSATLDGNLNLSLINGFTPSGGQQFTILTAGSIVDNGFVLTGSAASLFNLIVNSTSVMLQAIGLPGDFNHNGTVDAADYVVWRKGLGTTYAQADYDVWRAHFGQTSGIGSGVVTNAAVPEPATFMLLMLAASGSCLRRLRYA